LYYVTQSNFWTCNDIHTTGQETLELKSKLKHTKAELASEFEQISAAAERVGERSRTVKSLLDEGTDLVERIREIKWELEMSRGAESDRTKVFTRLTDHGAPHLFGN
jgi:chromosome segregation ATPase